MINVTMPNETIQWVSILEIIVWPTIVAASLIYFRLEIKTLISKITKFSVGGVDFDLSNAFVVSDVNINEKLNTLIGQDINQSNLNELFQQIESNKKYEYIIVNIGSGQKWLTSRLYIFSILLQKIAGIKSVVFVKSVENCKDKKFLGIASPDDIRIALASKFKNYEKVYFNAAYCDDQLNQVENEKDINFTNYIAQKFIEKLKSADFLHEHKVELKDGSHENAMWISGLNLEELICCNFSNKQIKSNWAKEKQMKKIVNSEADFIAYTDSEGNFKELINRNIVVTKLLKDKI